MTRNMKLLFSGSVLLNVLLAGMVIGHAVHPGMMGPPRPDFARDLPEAKRELVEGTMKRMREANRDLFKEMKSARKELMDIFSAPQFDAAQFDAANAKLAALRQQMQAGMSSAMKEVAPQLTQEERAQLAKQMRRMRPHAPPGDRADGPPPPPEEDDSPPPPPR